MEAYLVESSFLNPADILAQIRNLYKLYESLIPLLRLGEMFEDTKGVIRSRKLKKDRQHNGQNIY